MVNWSWYTNALLQITVTLMYM